MMPGPTLRETLAHVLSARPLPSSVEYLVKITTRMALIYLQQKIRTGRLRPSYYGLSLEDLALDCCAELFARDEEQRYTVLRTYFEAVGWREQGEADLQIALRRITFSKVNEELFRCNGELDPNLAKVIRNVKDAVKLIDGIWLQRFGCEQWVVAGEEELHMERPGIPLEFLEAYLTGAIGRSMHVREAVGALLAFAEMQPAYRNGVPLTVFARLVRSAFIRLGYGAEDADVRQEEYSLEELIGAIEAALGFIRRKMVRSYVHRCKVTAETFALYLEVVRSILEAQYIYDTLRDYSYFDIVAMHGAGISEAEYREQHRNRIEYMVKLSRSMMGARLLGRQGEAALA